MLLLTANPLPPFTSLLLSLALGLFLFPSFSQNSFLLPFSLSCHLSQNFITHLLHSNNPSCCKQKIKVLLVVRGKRSPWTILLPKPWVKRLPSSNQTILRRRNKVATRIVSALPSSTHGMILTFISLWCLVTIRLHCRAMCGFLFAAVTQRFLRPLWLPPFLILIYVKGHHFPCPFFLSLGRALLWVGRSGWTRSCLTQVSWRHYSKPVC